MAEAFEVVEPLDAEVWCVSSNGRPEKGWRCDRFFERVAIGEMRRIYSACDVLLKLSRVEGFFGPPMEMMACGGTVVVGRVTGHDEYIVDGENALVVEPRDVVAARAAVSRLLAEQPLRERLRRNGLATARAWRWETSIDALEKSFEDLVRGVRGKRADQALAESDASITRLYEAVTGIDVSGSEAPPRTPFAATILVTRALERRAWFRRLCEIRPGR